MPYVETDAGSVYYEDSGGDGPAIILSHGFLMDHRMFEPQVKELSDYRWIRWDTRHHGRSQTKATAYSYWDQARDGLAVLDELGIERAIFGGHSQGGFIALRMAVLRPQRCDGLMLFGTSASAYTSDQKMDIAGSSHSGPRGQRNQGSNLRAYSGDDDDRGHTGTAAAVDSGLARAGLVRLRACDRVPDRTRFR
ncbi:alpha/beta fold hydrolase [Rhodococcus hoagii]|nr:alpha/beta fold hydrolase [Prescottella equi]